MIVLINPLIKNFAKNWCILSNVYVLVHSSLKSVMRVVVVGGGGSSVSKKCGSPHFPFEARQPQPQNWFL